MSLAMWERQVRTLMPILRATTSSTWLSGEEAGDAALDGGDGEVRCGRGVVLGQRDGLSPEDLVHLDEVGDQCRVADAQRGRAIDRGGDVGDRTIDDDQPFDGQLGRADLDVLCGYLGEVVPDGAAVAGRMLVDVPDPGSVPDRGTRVGEGCPQHRGGRLLPGWAVRISSVAVALASLMDAWMALCPSSTVMARLGSSGDTELNGMSDRLSAVARRSRSSISRETGCSRWARAADGGTGRSHASSHGSGCRRDSSTRQGGGGDLGTCQSACLERRFVQPEGRVTQLGLFVR